MGSTNKIEIIDYKIVSGSYNDDRDGFGIHQKVKTLLAEGWQPIGGVYYASGGFHGITEFYQAMVKYEE